MISLLKKSSTQIVMKNITHLIRGYIAVVVVSPSAGGVDDQVKYCRPKIKLFTMIYFEIFKPKYLLVPNIKSRCFNLFKQKFKF